MSPRLRRRRYPRVVSPDGILVAWEAKDGPTISVVATFGAGGLFIPTTKPLEIGERVNLLIENPGHALQIPAVVRDSQPKKGMGVEFVTMSEDDRSILQRLLKHVFDAEPV